MRLRHVSPRRQSANDKKISSGNSRLWVADVVGSVALGRADTGAVAPDTQTQRAKDPAPIQGELANVDADAKTITVKLADGSDARFSYTEATEITGAHDGAAGLATMKNAKVTVHFTENAKDKSKTATRIIVQPAK